MNILVIGAATIEMLKGTRVAEHATIAKSASDAAVELHGKKWNVILTDYSLPYHDIQNSPIVAVGPHIILAAIALDVPHVGIVLPPPQRSLDLRLALDFMELYAGQIKNTSIVMLHVDSDRKDITRFLNSIVIDNYTQHPHSVTTVE